MEAFDFFTRFILPPILGGAGGFLTAWVGWDLEKRRARLKRRQDLVDSWRANLVPLLDPNLNVAISRGGHSMSQHPSYSSLRGHLSEKARRAFENLGEDGRPSGAIVVMQDGGPYLRQLLLNEIDQIERRWALI